MDIVLNFFKLKPNQKETEFSEYRIEYVKGLLVFDIIAVMPGLLTGDST
jgi:hypothetical protein